LTSFPNIIELVMQLSCGSTSKMPSFARQFTALERNSRLARPSRSEENSPHSRQYLIRVLSLPIEPLFFCFER
jgi:hypothetical protein